MTPLRGRYLTVPLRVKQGNSPAIVMFLGKLRTESWEVGDWFTQHYPALPSITQLRKLRLLDKQNHAAFQTMSKHDPSQLCKDTLRPIFVSFPQVQLWWDLQPLPLRHGLCHQGWLHWNLRCFALGDCKAASTCVNLTTPKDESKKVLQRIRRWARDGYILLFDFFVFFVALFRAVCAQALCFICFDSWSPWSPWLPYIPRSLPMSMPFPFISSLNSLVWGRRRLNYWAPISCQGQQEPSLSVGMKIWDREVMGDGCDKDP